MVGKICVQAKVGYLCYRLPDPQLDHMAVKLRNTTKIENKGCLLYRMRNHMGYPRNCKSGSYFWISISKSCIYIQPPCQSPEYCRKHSININPSAMRDGIRHSPPALSLIYSSGLSLKQKRACNTNIVINIKV